MIIIRPGTSNLEDRAYLAGKRTGIVARKTASISSESCGFDLYNCKFPIPQFVDLEDTDDKYKNDFFSYPFEKDENQFSKISITNTLTDEEFIITDDTYGKLYDFGDFPDRPEVSVMYLMWSDFVAANGFGNYQVKVELYSDALFTTLSETLLIRCFEVMPFSCDSAHRTVRFETIQTGYINNGFDYRDLFYNFNTVGYSKGNPGVIQQLRWYGRMYQDVPNEEDDFHQISSRVEQQIQQKITDKYKIELYHLHSEFGKHLTNDNFLATEVYVSDFNLNNYEVYRDLFLRKISTDEWNDQLMNPTRNPVFTFKKMDEGTLKRVYG